MRKIPIPRCFQREYQRSFIIFKIQDSFNKIGISKIIYVYLQTNLSKMLYMEKLIIKFPCNDIEIDELKSIFSDINEVKVVESDNKNFDATVLADIIVNIITEELPKSMFSIANLVLMFMTYKQGVLANKKVDLYDDEGNIIKLNIRIKDINRVIYKIDNESD